MFTRCCGGVRDGAPARVDPPSCRRRSTHSAMGYWTYYLLWFFLAYASDYPALVVGAVAMFLLRGFIPDPWIWLRTARRMHSLKAHIAANPWNVTARRDLA